MVTRVCRLGDEESEKPACIVPTVHAGFVIGQKAVAADPMALLAALEFPRFAVQLMCDMPRSFA